MTLQEVFADPEFRKMQAGDKIKILDQMDSDFQQLPQADKVKVIITGLYPQLHDSAQSQDKGFWSTIGDDLSNAPGAILGMLGDPKGTFKRAIQAQASQASQAVDSYGKGGAGNFIEGTGHGMAALLPLIGPLAAEAGTDIGEGKPKQGLARSAELLAPSVLPRVVRAGVDAAKDVSLADIAGSLLHPKVALGKSLLKLGSKLSQGKPLPPTAKPSPAPAAAKPAPVKPPPVDPAWSNDIPMPPKTGPNLTVNPAVGTRGPSASTPTGPTPPMPSPPGPSPTWRGAPTPEPIPPTPPPAPGPTPTWKGAPTPEPPPAPPPPAPGPSPTWRQSAPVPTPAPKPRPSPTWTGAPQANTPPAGPMPNPPTTAPAPPIGGLSGTNPGQVTQKPVLPGSSTPVQAPATSPTVLSTAKGADAAEALKNELVPGSPPGEVATIPGSDTGESGQVAHMLNRAKSLGLTSESVQTLSPAEKVKVVDLINQSPHTPSVKSQIMGHLGLGDDIGQFAKGGVVSPGDKYDTKLTPQEETQFQQWKKVNAPHDSGVDYDLRGAFKGGANPAQNGHFPDTWKKPNHPTFSNESKYATQDAPHWEGNRLIDKTGKVITDESPQIQGEEPMPNPKVGFITPMAKGGVVVPKTVLSTVKGADVRSGEDIIRGTSNIPLSANGVQQAKELGGKFKTKGGVHHIDSSHLKRAVQTADAIHKATGAPIRAKLKDLSPWHLGEIEGQPTTQVLDRIHKYVLKQPNVKVPGMGPESTAPGESFNTFKRRFLGHLEEKLKELKANPSLKLAQVTHYRDVRLAQAWAAKGFPKSMEINPKFMTEKGSDPPGSVLRLFWKGSKPSLVKVNMDSPDKLPGGVYLVRHGVTRWNQENKEKK